MTWIPVRERLPDTNREVLVWTITEEMFVACFNAQRQAWFADCNWPLATHWMELPPRPEEPQ